MQKMHFVCFSIRTRTLTRGIEIHNFGRVLITCTLLPNILYFKMIVLCSELEKICLLFIILLENFSLILRRNHSTRRAANQDLLYARNCSEGVFSLSQLLWHRMVVHVTVIPVAKRLAVSFNYLDQCVAIGSRTPDFPMRGKRSYRLRHSRVN